MILLSPEGWGNGLSATFGFIFGLVLGVWIVIQARKVKAKILTLMGLNIIVAGFGWVGITLDFLSILLTGNNLPNPGGWMGIINIMGAPLVLAVSLYIGGELMIPKLKKYIVASFLIITVIFEFFLFTNPLGTFEFEDPIPSGSNLILIKIVTESPSNYLYISFQFIGFFFCGFGYLIKSFKSSGVIKRKFLSLSIGYLLFVGIPIFSGFMSRMDISIPIVLSRLIMASAFLFFYFGLREAPAEKKKKEHYVKEVKVEESLFRVYERPLQISEEEVIFHRDRKICLVCKGSVIRLSYICPKCNALYCINCSEVLSNQENMCWVCNEPLDESKPTRPHKIIYKDINGLKKKAE